ncbi:hypothetical protein CC99x_000665 [Candidatus Berkiella cookevillensis]|uniref:YcxB-like C-terminal domain-containing protein n=1 Tax=Candidatus Berkiella cookevillensis TaxID=437022 RepID=A0A0Q9YLS5_9GAMM|nr:YcxB family protein [Candidatus Berkiella cookevillensis]MCS5707406.1 hypothetical protein [Candidatus Berkiella cookevillensis]
MNIKIQYIIDGLSLARASFIFSEKKPFILYSIGFFNIIAALFSVIMITKGLLLNLTQQELILLIVMLLWLFARKPLVRWIFKRKMKKINTIGKTMVIEISRNGIMWSGEGIKTGHLAWQYISYILEIKNGFIIPYSVNRFLWLPNTGFKSKLQIEKIKTLIIEKHVPLRVYPKLEC